MFASFYDSTNRYVREWNFQASTAKICALGLRRVAPGEKGSTINGVIFQAPGEMAEFDKRENGYTTQMPAATPRDPVLPLIQREIPY